MCHHIDSETFESLGKQPEVAHTRIADQNVAASHSRNTDKAADLYHIGKEPVVGSAEPVSTCDGKQIGTDSFYPGTHAHKHPAQLLDVRLACSIIYHGLTLGEHSRHNDVGSTGDRSLVEQHVGAFQTLRRRDIVCPPFG